MKHKGSDPAKLLDFIDTQGLSYRTTAKSYVFSCPKCGKEDKLYLRKRDGRFICWFCSKSKGFQGAPEYALNALTDIPLESIRKALYGSLVAQATLTLDFRILDFYDELDENEVIVDEDIEAFLELPDLQWPHHCLPLTHQGSKNGVAYLEGRGVPVDVALRYDIRYSPERRSVAFPVWMGDKLVGYQFRTIDPTLVMGPSGPVKLLKTISSPDIPRDRCVMFANRLTSDFAVLCEGPFDAIKLDGLGSGNVATMGKVVSQNQIELLLRSGIRKLYIALDPDAADEINPILRSIGGVDGYLVELPCKPGQGKVDLGSLTMGEAAQCVLDAKPMKNNRLHGYLEP
jgi:hypothetical protein